MANDANPSSQYAKIARWATLLAASISVGVLWALTETVIHRGLFPPSFYYSRSITTVIANRTVFYGCISVLAWAFITAAGAVYDHIRGRKIGIAETAGRALVGVAAGAVWVNLSLIAVLLTYRIFGPGGAKNSLFPALASLIALAAVITLFTFTARVRRRSPAVRRTTKTVGRVVLIGGLVGGFALHGALFIRAMSRPVPDGLPDVVVITLDAWRADGLNADFAPAVTAYADEYGVTLNNVYSPSSFTPESFAGMLTGSYNVTRGDYYEYKKDLRPTWAEVMRENGYDTYAVLCNPYLETIRIMFRGFASFDYVRFHPFLRAVRYYDSAWYFASRGRKAGIAEPGLLNRLLTEKALTVLRKPTRRPKFVWIHYFDPHYPYRPTDELLATEAPWLIGSQEYGYKRNKLRPENVETIKALYDYEIKTTDAYVAEVLAEIRNRPNTLVIISSDHGEEFLEHGFYEHRKTLYEETTRVPLVIAMPARDNASLETVEPDTPISLVDLAPSVLNYLGIEVPTTMDGEPGLLTGDVTADRPVFTVLRTGGEKSLAAVIVKEKKAIMAALPAETSFEYYDLESDPGEQRPLPEDDGFSHLTALLETWFISRTNRPGSVGPESRLPEERKDLKALGYM